MAESLTQSMHALILPTSRVPMLVPSTMTAEIMGVPKISPLPFSEPWVLGVIGWRKRAIPVVSFEILLGDRVPPVMHPRSKVVVFQPLQGHNEWDFFGLLVSADPQPYTISDTKDLSPSETPINNPVVGATVTIGRTAVVIPDMEALQRIMYPGSR
ncbi:MAG: chemotaxis protein CheW [Acidiferrobacterales bacterium]